MEFAVHQLVEIAMRALSPSINEPFTAVVCVDRLGSALSRLAQRDIRCAREGLPEEEGRREAEDRYPAANRALHESVVPSHHSLERLGAT